MELICILDTETTGLDANKGKVLEIAAVLYNIQSRSIITQASTLCYAEENPAFDINRIAVESLKKTPPKIEGAALGLIADMMSASDALIAHNAEFDKKFINTIVNLQLISRSKKWICTRNDVTWPIRKGISLNLVSICVDLGVPVINAHRALADCHLILGALECLEDIQYFLDKSGIGRITYHAEITFSERQLAKDNGFTWDNLKKVWHKQLTPDEAVKIPFMVYPAESTLRKT
jgi:DNA polymerase III subunit epsilon